MRENKQKVIIRADGNTEIGLGHVIRSLALADMLKEHFNCIFATRFLSTHIESEANKVCSLIIKLPETEDEHLSKFLSFITGDEIVVLDNYFYSTDYQKSIKDKGAKLVCIDDIHDKHFVADAVINHAGGSRSDDYSIENYTKLYLGFKYALLRRSFLETESTIQDNNNVLICLGGADPNNDTLNVLDFVTKKCPEYNYHVVTGNAYVYKKELHSYTEKKDNITLYASLNETEMCELMQNCSRAICSPSTVSLEYLCSTKGELYLSCIADNQNELYNYYIDNKIGFDISQFTQSEFLFNTDLINELFDGKQKDRIINIFNGL